MTLPLAWRDVDNWVQLMALIVGLALWTAGRVRALWILPLHWVLVYAAQWAIWWRNRSRGVVTIPPVPIFGLRLGRVFVHARHMHKAVQEEMDMLGVRVWHSWMWHLSVLAVSDAAAIRDMLVAQQPNFERSWWEVRGAAVCVRVLQWRG